MKIHWMDCERDFVARRYDRLAGFITFFEWLLWIPRGFRARAVESIELKSGDRVLEIGCGTGRNLSYLREAVGPDGHVYGVDLSEKMLARARTLCVRNEWDNVTLMKGDAADFPLPDRLDGVLFGFSYTTMPDHRFVLQRTIGQLGPQGRLVIMDAKLPSGPFRKLILPFGVWLMRHTLLGNPLVRPWDHVAATTEQFQMWEFLFGSYYICRGLRPRSQSLKKKDRREVAALV